MDKKEFDELWENIAKIEIDKTIIFRQYRVEAKENDKNFKENAYSRYQSEREKFRRVAGIKDSSKLDRHKVAALFYVAFVDKTDGYSFNVFGSRNERLLEAEAAITHETALNIARGIIVSFIVEDSGIDTDYREFVAENGMMEPELICFENSSTSYKEEALKQLIYAQKENKLSVSQLALIFFSLEDNTRHCYRKTKTHNL